MSDTTPAPMMQHRRTPLSSRKRRSRRASSEKDEPFIFLVIKVGCCILCICWAVTHAFLLLSTPAARSSSHIRDLRSSVRDSTEFPEFHLNHWRLKGDVFGVHDIIISQYSNRSGLGDFDDEAARLKEEFMSRYGGENAARYLIHSGVTTYLQSSSMHSAQANANGILDDIPLGLKYTAHRIISARKEHRPFSIAFGGYSVTAGRGNYFHQSYPFVLEKLLTKPMELLGIELQVRNAAIGGVPSFPYGWCLSNFLGDDSDVISWDYSMNEAGGLPDGLESYLRYGLSMRRRPMLIVKDTSAQFSRERYDLLQSYVNNGALKDPIVLSIEDAMESFLHLKEELLPVGFKRWKEFGAPNGAPGQTSHHPGVKQHELYGWLLAMHFLAALELVAAFASGDRREDLIEATLATSTEKFPPIHGSTIDSSLYSLFYGAETMNQVHCWTTYDPILNNDLKDLVVSGSVGEDLDIMLPRGAQLYNKGWVLDLSQSEKNAKLKLHRYGGLGYIDSKKAYYGIYSSGQLELFLPCIGRGDVLQRMQTSSILANECFRSVVVCEVNEKHTGSECDMMTDLSFHVGGIKSEDIKPVDVKWASYWGRNICLRVGVPSKSLIEPNHRSNGDVQAGISFAISVASTSVMLRTGPCSISHIISLQS